MDNLILEAIQEELGVSNDVASLSDKIADVVLQNAQKLPRNRIEAGISTNTFKIPLKNVFGVGLTIKVTNTFFGDRRYFAAYREKKPRGANIYSKDEGTLDMYFDYINEEPVSENFYGSFYHEFKHIFQDVKSGGGYKQRPNYQMSVWGINHKNEMIKTVSEIVYYATEKEIYAFAGQAYEAIMHMDFFNSAYNDVREAVLDTNLYMAYEKLKQGMAYLSSHKGNDTLTNVLNKFGVNFNQIEEHCEWAIKEYAKYIGRVIVKCEKDLFEKRLNEGTMVDFPDEPEVFLEKMMKVYPDLK